MISKPKETRNKKKGERDILVAGGRAPFERRSQELIGHGLKEIASEGQPCALVVTSLKGSERINLPVRPLNDVFEGTE